MTAFRTADGRVLEHLEVGDPQGRPVVYLPGTPGTAGAAVLLDEGARRQHVRLVSISRPGYGESTTTAPGLASVAGDVGELVDRLGVDEFAVLGTSGGGPFALAVGAVLPSRVTTVLLAASSGSYVEVAPEMVSPDDRRALELVAGGDIEGALAVLTPGVSEMFGPMARRSVAEFIEGFNAAPPTEHYFDNRPEERATFLTDMHRALTTYDGFIRDNLSWLGSWDIDLGDVVAPVRLSYGDADVMVPPAHGEWLAERLASAELVVHPGADHGTITFGLVEPLLATVT
jgi:pimeloyl-ACP methyl ester carboxylesterase